MLFMSLAVPCLALNYVCPSCSRFTALPVEHCCELYSTSEVYSCICYTVTLPIEASDLDSLNQLHSLPNLRTHILHD